jgi:predicted ATPase
MNSHDQYFPTLQLDPHLLSTHFAAQTRWHVITGAPCSGKTTLIDLLVANGFQTVPEVGRKYIEGEIARGRTLAEIRASEAAFAIMIKELSLATERGLPVEEVIFLDRAFPDCLTFYRLHGLDPNEILPECFHHHYASVFVLDRFPVQKDTARVEDDNAAAIIDEWLARDYSALGYPVVRVPVLPPEDRLAFILERISS